MANTFNDQNTLTKENMQGIVLTDEDRKKLHDCYNDGAFMKAILPGTVWGFGMGYVGAWLTRFRSKAHFAGAVCSVLGFMTGKVYYMSQCLQKLAHDPTSSLYHQLNVARNTYGNYPQERTDLSPSSSSESATTHKFDNSLSISVSDDQTYPVVASFDEFSNPSDDYAQHEEKDLTETPLPQPTLSYDELRRKNREDYMRKYQRAYPNDDLLMRPQTLPQPSPEPSTAPGGRMKTKYGDVWD